MIAITATMQVDAARCSLADHIRSANTNTSVGGCPQGTSHDIITLNEDITLKEALPPITGTITIAGNGRSISGGDLFRLYDVSGGRLTLKNLTLTAGYTSEDGGAIRLRNGGTLTVENSTFKGNRANRGGAIALVSDNTRLTVESSSFVGNQANDQGGAIYNHGNATITKSSFLDNGSIDGLGGAIMADSGATQISNSTFHNNQAWGGGVLGVWRAEVTMTHVTMVNNRSTIRGSDAIDKLNGIVKLRNSLVVNRGYAKDCYSGLDQNIGNLSLDGHCGVKLGGDALLGDLAGWPAYIPLRDYSPAIDAAHPSFCLDTDQIGAARPHGGGCDIGAIEATTALPPELPILPPPPCPLADQIMAANADAPAGGCPAGSGHDVITLTGDIALSRKLPAVTSNITIEGNGFTISGRSRLPIFTVNAGTLTIKNVTLADANTLQRGGGAILVQSNGAAVVSDSTFINNIALFGGAIDVDRGSGLTVNNSHFLSNRSGVGGAIKVSTFNARVTIANSSFVNNNAMGFSGKGGGVSIGLSNAVDISNSTFINNRAKVGGALFSSRSTVTLTHVTVLNSATTGNAIHNDGNGAVRLRNSIIAVTEPTWSALCSGPLTQNFSNLIEDGSCSPALRDDPMLEATTEASRWLAPQPGSPAKDAADARFCPTRDQVGRARPQGIGCDIGAIEWSAAGSAHPDRNTAEQALTECTVTTTHVLNFRDGPGGRRIGLVREGAELPVAGRAPGWFQIEYRGRTGWISADYVVALGVCG